MGFVNRRKQPAKFRSNPFPTPEQILTGLAVSVTERAVEKAVARFARTKKGELVEVSRKAVATSTPVSTPKAAPKKKAKVSKTKER